MLGSYRAHLQPNTCGAALKRQSLVAMLLSSRCSAPAGVQCRQSMHQLSTRANVQVSRTPSRCLPTSHHASSISPLDAASPRVAGAFGARSYAGGSSRTGSAQCRSTDGSVAACSQPEQPAATQQRAPDGVAPASLSAQVAHALSAAAPVLQHLRRFRCVLVGSKRHHVTFQRAQRLFDQQK